MKEGLEMKKKQLAMIAGIIVIIIVLITAIVKLNTNEQPKEPLESEQVEDKNADEIEGTQLNTLPAEAFEIQDNTITDTWGVVLKHDQLPEELQGGESYTITIDGTVYDLTLNKYNSNVYNGQVSSIEHTEEEVGQGAINKK